MGAADVEEFISDLCEDVREFLMYLRQEIMEVTEQIGQRDNKCKQEIDQIYASIQSQIAMKLKLGNLLDAKESQKIDAFKEHADALNRHILNTNQFLRKELLAVEDKIKQIKESINTQLGIFIEEDNESRTIEGTEELNQQYLR